MSVLLYMVVYSFLMCFLLLQETGRIEIVPSLQILRENGGTLAEAHIVILTELWMWIQDQASVEDSKEVDGGGRVSVCK